MATSESNEDETRVLDYMRQANRPYSANDIFGNLHKAVGKASVQRCLDALVERGDLCEKTSGKQKVYVAKQLGLASVIPDAEARQMEARAVEAERTLAAEQMEVKRLQQRLHHMKSAPSCDELRARLEQLRPQLAERQTRLAAIDGIDGEPPRRVVTPGQLAEARKLRVTFVSEWRKRKRACTELINCVLEGYPATKKAFFEEVGLETDEEYKATMPDI